MPDLEARLLALGRDLEYPNTPDLAASVGARLARPAVRRFDSRYLAIAAAILIVTIGGLLAFPATRDAIAGFFGLRGVLIERVPSLTTPTASPAGSLAQRLALGRQVSFGEAQAALPYTIAYPQSLGPPDAVFLLQPAERQGVALVWSPRADLPLTAETGVGALLIEFPGKVQPDFFIKMLGPDATLESVRVGGNAGYWISGRPHDFVFLDPHGDPQQDSFRLAGNSLVWNQGTRLIRIESALGKDQTLALANGTH
ncbi:MAG: hypothetical protein ABI401_10810 [Candidatus Dormibacter sp.]